MNRTGTQTRTAADALRVRHLRLRGRAADLRDLAGSAGARDALGAELARAAWPIVGDDEVLLVRRLQVHSTAAELAARGADQARALAARSADPWGPGAAQAEALRFRSRAEFAAWRLVRTLDAPAGAEAASDILIESAAELPAVWEQLRAAGRGPKWLDRLWQQLDAEAAERVLLAAAAATGWMRSVGAAAQAGAARAASAFGPATDAVASGHGQVIVDRGRTPGTPAALRAAGAWPTKATVHKRVGLLQRPSHDARTRLAAFLAVWMDAPAVLHGSEGATTLHAVAQWLAAGGGADEAALARPASSRPSEAPTRRSEVRSQGDATSLPPDARSGLAGAASPSPEATRPLPVAASATDSAKAQRPASTPASTSDPTTARHEPITDPTQDFVTGQGGLFWLLALLALPPWLRRLQSLDEPQAGWREWIRCVQALGAAPDAAWWQFAANAGQLGEPQAARALRWPAPLADELLEAARARYGDDALNAALAPRRARVRASASRVDVHFALADAAIEVRRAGLDIDPGWVPWLGRVLRWHFGDALAPGPAPAAPSATPPRTGPQPRASGGVPS